MSKIGQEIIVRSRFFGKWKIATKGIYAKAMIVLFENDGRIVASFPPLNTNGYGDTAEEAIESLHVVIQEAIYAIPSTFKLAATFGMDWVLTEPPPVDPKYCYHVDVDFWFDRGKKDNGTQDQDMKASEALELMNMAREEAKMERRPLLDDIMPGIYDNIKEAAMNGKEETLYYIGHIPKSLREDAVNLLLSNGFKLEYFSEDIDGIYSIIVKW